MIKKLCHIGCVIVAGVALVLGVPSTVRAQDSGNVPGAVQAAADEVSDVARRFRLGAEAGIALDPELIMFGAHGSFGPLFTRNVTFRPGIEFGLGELTTLFGINLDALYTFPGAAGRNRWTPYVGAGPNFTLSHQSFQTTDTQHVDVNTTAGTTTTTNGRSRFNFSDTDFNGGFNFIAGARRGGLFLEMKATAYGVSNVRLLAGFNF